MRKSGLILLFSLFAFVLLIAGAGTATAIVLKDHDSPGKSESSMEPIEDHSKITFQQWKKIFEENNDIELYYIGYGDPQFEYISSHHSIYEYYTGGGKLRAIYPNAYDATEMSIMVSWYFHMYEKIDDYYDNVE